MNKKTYIVPQVSSIQVKPEGMFATSDDVTMINDSDDMESGANSLSDRRGAWNSELWAN